MKSKLVVLILMVLVPLISLSQKLTQNGPAYISLAYYGEKIFHPGLSISLQWEKQISSDSNSISQTFQFGGAFAGYTHPRNHTGLQLKSQAQYNFTFRKGFELGVLAELGYMRRFYNGEVFEVENGNVSQVQLAGQNAIIYGGYLHIGYNPTLNSDKKMKYFFQIGGFWEYPFNDGALFHPAISIGLSKKLF